MSRKKGFSRNGNRPKVGEHGRDCPVFKRSFTDMVGGRERCPGLNTSGFGQRVVRESLN